jgi:hypothetical protein
MEVTGSSPAAPAILFPHFPQQIEDFPVYVSELGAFSASFLPDDLAKTDLVENFQFYVP